MEHVALAEVQCVRAVAVPVPHAGACSCAPRCVVKKLLGRTDKSIFNFVAGRKSFSKNTSNCIFFVRSNDDYEGSRKTNQKKNGSTSSLPNLCFKLFFVFVMLSLFIFQ